MAVTTLARLYAKITEDLKEPMADIRRRMSSNEASPEEWRMYTEFRRCELLYPPAAAMTDTD